MIIAPGEGGRDESAGSFYTGQVCRVESQMAGPGEQPKPRSPSSASLAFGARSRAGARRSQGVPVAAAYRSWDILQSGVKVLRTADLSQESEGSPKAPVAAGM